MNKKLKITLLIIAVVLLLLLYFWGRTEYPNMLEEKQQLVAETLSGLDGSTIVELRLAAGGHLAVITEKAEIESLVAMLSGIEIVSEIPSRNLSPGANAYSCTLLSDTGDKIVLTLPALSLSQNDRRVGGYYQIVSGSDFYAAIEKYIS